MTSIFNYGTDPRFERIAARLSQEGFSVIPFGKSQEKALYLFPLGSGDEILDELENVGRNSLVFVGKISEEMRLFSQKKGVRFLSFLEDEAYRRENSIATAEGVLSAVIQHTPSLLRDTCILLCGFGHCGSEIARLLWLCGCEVWVFSRQGSMEKARREGFNTYEAPGEKMGMFDAIINTVPEKIFSPDFFRSVRPGTPFFQVASGLSGISPNETEKMNVSFYPLPGLPGIYAPESEADALYRVISPYLIHFEKESE